MIPITRNLMRVLAGVLVGQGVTDWGTAETILADPQLVEVVAGGMVWAGSEAWYGAAKRFGWNT
jgi:hypothetical protein